VISVVTLCTCIEFQGSTSFERFQGAIQAPSIGHFARNRVRLHFLQLQQTNAAVVGFPRLVFAGCRAKRACCKPWLYPRMVNMQLCTCYR
jgi:hypothetical protein